MHNALLTVSLQEAIDRYLDREMHPAEAATFIRSMKRSKRRQDLLDREIQLRQTLQARAERPRATPDFMARLRGAIAAATDE